VGRISNPACFDGLEIRSTRRGAVTRR